MTSNCYQNSWLILSVNAKVGTPLDAVCFHLGQARQILFISLVIKELASQDIFYFSNQTDLIDSFLIDTKYSVIWMNCASLELFAFLSAT